MNPQSASPASPTTQQRPQEISRSFREFFRQYLTELLPSEADNQVEAIVTQAVTELRTACEHEHSATEATLISQAIRSAIASLRAAKTKRATQAVGWLDLNNSELPTNPQELVQNLQQAMARLPEKQRRVLGLGWAGLTIDEIADLLGCSTRKAQRLREQAQQAVRKFLEGEGIEYEVN